LLNLPFIFNATRLQMDVCRWKYTLTKKDMILKECLNDIGKAKKIMIEMYYLNRSIFSDKSSVPTCTINKIVLKYIQIHN